MIIEEFVNPILATGVTFGKALLVGAGVIVAAVAVIVAAVAVKKIISRTRRNTTNTPMPINSSPTDKRADKNPNTISVTAKQSFLDNIGLFTSKLNTLCDGTYNDKDWNDAIDSINNKDLTNLWMKIHLNTDSILRIFASWGIKPDFCDAFVAGYWDAEKYSDSDNLELKLGHRYNVISYCWLLTGNDGTKRIIVKGKAKMSK